MSRRSEAIIEPSPGTYALVLAADRTQRLRIGRLGRLPVRRGFFVYVGSALGPGGVRARVQRHQRANKRIHWHIDYLLATTRLECVWFTYDPIRREHEWAGLFSSTPGATIPLPGFGASDCRCNSHLIHFTSRPGLDSFRRRVRSAPGGGPQAPAIHISEPPSLSRQTAVATCPISGASAA